MYIFPVIVLFILLIILQIFFDILVYSHWVFFVEALALGAMSYVGSGVWILLAFFVIHNFVMLSYLIEKECDVLDGLFGGGLLHGVLLTFFCYVVILLINMGESERMMRGPAVFVGYWIFDFLLRKSGYLPICD